MCPTSVSPLISTWPWCGASVTIAEALAHTQFTLGGIGPLCGLGQKPHVLYPL